MTFARNSLLIIIILLSIPIKSYSETDTLKNKIGLSYSLGRQDIFPFGSKDYSYEIKGFKLVFNHILSSGRITLELQIEPSVYKANHQLLNPSFVKPGDYPDYLVKREVFTKTKTINEFALNAGIVARYCFSDMISVFILGSIGPMYSGTETERLAKGFAFSDIVEAGISVKKNRIIIELRPGLRHVSNANLQSPNSGHNSSTIDIGILYNFQKFKNPHQ